MDSKPKKITFTCTNTNRSKGGKNAALMMTAEQRRERAIKANQAKKCYLNVPKATHFGDLLIGDTTISCAVLDNGKRVITETSVFELLKRSRRGRKKVGEQLPAFLSPLNLRPFITNDLTRDLSTFEYIHPKRGKVKGIEATLIPQICKVYLDAKMAGVLHDSQLNSAFQCYIITQALAQTGIISLIDESTGYQRDRQQNELQQLFERFIEKELQPWTRKFPPIFFENIKRMYGLEHLTGNPKFAGHLINKYIYKEISVDILEELKKRNPKTENGYRKFCHHQYLTHDIGHPALDKQILKINTLMSVSDNKEEFEKLFEKSKRKES